MLQAKNINSIENSRKSVDRIRESLMKKTPEEVSNKDELEFLLKRL